MIHFVSFTFHGKGRDGRLFMDNLRLVKGDGSGGVVIGNAPPVAPAPAPVVTPTPRPVQAEAPAPVAVRGTTSVHDLRRPLGSSVRTAAGARWANEAGAGIDHRELPTVRTRRGGPNRCSIDGPSQAGVFVHVNGSRQISRTRVRRTDV